MIIATRISQLLNSALVLLLLSFLSILPANSIANEDGGIEIPVEFFFGRWAPGLAIGGEGQWDKRYPPIWQSNATYASQRYRAGVGLVSGFDLESNPTNLTEQYAGFVQIRPNPRWQFGFDQLEYKKSHTDPRFKFTDFLQTDQIRSFSLGSVWSNEETSVLSGDFARYSYGGMHLSGYRQLLWRTNLHYSSQNSDAAVVWQPPLPVNEYYSRTLSFQSSVQYGLSERAHLEGNVVANWEKDGLRSYVIQYPPDEWREQYSRALWIQASVAAVASLGKNLFVRPYASHTFERSESGVESTGGFGWASDTVKTPLKGINSEVGAGFSYVGKGEFIPIVILDDYLGYYHGMLFPGQQRLDLDFAYESRPKHDAPRDYLLRTRLSLRQGLPGGFEFGGYANYTWWVRWTRRSSIIYLRPSVRSYYELFDWSLSLRWRSFEYTPDDGPGWDSDSPLDIAFGPQPRPLHFYVGVMYQSPTFHTNGLKEDIGFLSFEKLTAQHIHEVKFDLEVGLYEGVSFQANVVWTIDARDYYLFDTPNHSRMILGMEMRLLSNLRTSIRMEQTHSPDDSSPATVTFSAGGLFW